MKRPKPKPWYRPRNVCLAVLGAVLLFFGWAFLEVWQVYTAEPNPTVDYRAKVRELAEQHTQISREAADEGWQLLLDAIELSKTIQMQAEAELIDNGFSPRSEWDNGEIDFSYVLHGAPLRHEIDRERSCLERMREQGLMEAVAAFVEKAPGLRQPRGEGPMITDHLPELAAARGLTSALAAQMRIAATEGDFVQAAIAFEQIVAVAHTIWIQPSLIDHLVGQAIWTKALEELRYELSEFHFDEPSCERFFEVLHRFEAPPVTLAIHSERLFLHDLIQWSFTDDGNDNGYLLAEGPAVSFTLAGERSLFRAAANRFYFGDRKTTERLLDEYMQDLIRQAGTLPIDRQPSIESDRFDESIFSSPRHMFLAAIIPALEKAQTKSSIVQLQTRGTHLMLAIEKFFASHGELPKQLDDLVPSILTELPTDPMHGGSFLYRRLQNDSRNRRYLLYSSGLDQQDNGGDFSLLDSFEAVTHPPTNTDFLVNQLRSALDDY